MENNEVLGCLDSSDNCSVSLHTPFFVAHFASLLRLSFRGCFWNWQNKLMFSKLHDVLSWNLHVSSIFIFKEKGCNHFTLKSQEWFSMTILLINDEVRGACCYLAALCLTQFTRFLLSLSLEASSSLLSAEF